MQAEAWKLARAAADAAGVDIRPLTTLEEAERITDVMVATWGEHQLLPRELLRAFQDSGNVPYGAFADEELIGYVLGFLGVDEEGLHVHSHMLATLPDRRSKGVGYALKLVQRAVALDLDVHLVRWTFDPMLRGNANFNFCKLGTVADRFGRDFYGGMGDLLNVGERTDRLVIRWELDRAPGPRPIPPGEERRVLGKEGPEEGCRPGRVAAPELPPGGSVASIAIPRDYRALGERDPELAAAWRDAVAEALEACFSLGMIVAGFDPEACVYRLAPRDAEGLRPPA